MSRLLLCAAASFLIVSSSYDSAKRFVYVGLYNTSTDAGTFDSAGYAETSVLIYDVDGRTGELTQRSRVAAGLNASWIAAHPSGRFVYIVSEVQLYEGRAVGSVAAFAVDERTGMLTFVNRVPTGHPQPVFAEVDASGRYLLVATYAPGVLEVFDLQQDGRLREGPAQAISQGQGTHCARFDGSGQHVLSAVLGLDKVDQYTWTSAGKSSQRLRRNPAGPSATFAPGTGPRHIAFHPLRSDRVYIADEGGEDTPSRLTVCEYSEQGTLSVLQTLSTIGADVNETDMYPAEVVVSDDGRFAFVSNRDGSMQRRDSIAVFGLNSITGMATLLETTSTRGWYPRSIALDWSRHMMLVANQKSNDVVSFSIDAQTGLLLPTFKSSGSLSDAAAFVGFMHRPNPEPAEEDIVLLLQEDRGGNIKDFREL